MSGSDSSFVETGDQELDAARAKYAAERAKRLRSDGNEQYIEVKGDFSHYVDDPYADPNYKRDPVECETEVLIIGGGFAGLIVAARLRIAGFVDLRIVEKGGNFGGVWYWNRYPGAQCDIESYVYLPLLEETGYLPTEKYAHRTEIYEHAQRIARKYDLHRSAYFQTIVTDLRWRDDEQRWIVKTDRGDTISARFVVQTNGLLDRAKLPWGRWHRYLSRSHLSYEQMGLRLHRRRFRRSASSFER